jgi:hypothetical protein
LTDKSSPNSRACFLAREIILPGAQAQEVNHLELILQAQLVLHCLHQPKMNQWKDIQVKKVIVIDFVVQIEVLRHLDLEVSEK